MILEAIVATRNEDGSANISPMGPRVDVGMDRFTLKPFNTSLTYHNLVRTGEGVLHVTDDVELIARAAVGRLDPLPELRPSPDVAADILADACRWYAFRAVGVDDTAERVSIDCETIARGTQREFFGFNRAKHAVLEAAILATRTFLLSEAEIREQLSRLRPLVEKTAGEQERRAFAFLEGYLEEIWAAE